MWNDITGKLVQLYGTKGSSYLIKEIKTIVSKLKKHQKTTITSKDIALITYADTVAANNEKTLQTFKKFSSQINLDKFINIIHFLPFYPWDTDKGFSVQNYYEVNKGYGNWKDVKYISKKFKLMFDFVANHASIDNPLIQNSLIESHLSQNDPRYKNYAYYKDFVISFDRKNKPTDDELRNLARPRPNPVLTEYYVVDGKLGLKAILGQHKGKQKTLGGGYVWTTFSRPKNKDGSETTKQVDLNFKNPAVFLETIKILIFYIEKGASLIRLDAIGYIWKKLGSSSLHEKEAHLILEVLHDILKVTVPQITTIAEVNESQDKFYEYLGGKNHEESDMVYQFSHFPLAIYGVLTGNGKPYINWLKTLDKFKGRQFITVLGSHDGLGLKPIREMLPEADLLELTNILVNKHKCLPNFAILPGGKKIIYEICATPWNLINSPSTKDSLEIQLKRYIAVLALGLTVRGLPGIYINGLLGSLNYSPKKGLDEYRTINREVFSYTGLIKELESKTSRTQKVFQAVKKILDIRSKENVFDPNAPTPEVIDTNNSSVIASKLTDIKRKQKLYSFINISNKKQTVKTHISEKKLTDLLLRNTYITEKEITLSPYQILWLV